MVTQASPGRAASGLVTQGWRLSCGRAVFATAPKGGIAPQHYAFLVSDEEFDVAFVKIRERGITYWADPGHRREGEINRNDGGRGVYFLDPNGHNLELITVPYGGWPTR